MIEPTAGNDREAIEMGDVISSKEPGAEITDDASDGVYGLLFIMSMRD